LDADHYEGGCYGIVEEGGQVAFPDFAEFEVRMRIEELEYEIGIRDELCGEGYEGSGVERLIDGAREGAIESKGIFGEEGGGGVFEYICGIE